MTQSIFLIFFVMVLSSNKLHLFFLPRYNISTWFCLWSHSGRGKHLLRNRLDPYSTSESFLKFHFCSNPKASFSYLENRFVFLMQFLHPDKFFGISLHSSVDFRAAVWITHQESVSITAAFSVAEGPWVSYQKQLLRFFTEHAISCTNNTGQSFCWCSVSLNYHCVFQNAWAACTASDLHTRPLCCLNTFCVVE